MEIMSHLVEVDPDYGLSEKDIFYAVKILSKNMDSCDTG